MRLIDLIKDLRSKKTATAFHEMDTYYLDHDFQRAESHIFAQLSQVMGNFLVREHLSNIEKSAFKDHDLAPEKTRYSLELIVFSRQEWNELLLKLEQIE